RPARRGRGGADSRAIHHREGSPENGGDLSGGTGFVGGSVGSRRVAERNWICERQHGLLGLLAQPPFFVGRQLLARNLMPDGGVDFTLLDGWRQALKPLLLPQLVALLLTQSGLLG